MIGDDVEIVVVDIKGDQIKIGIKAPKTVTVHRTEVLQEIKNQNKLATEYKIKPDELSKLGNIFVKKK